MRLSTILGYSVASLALPTAVFAASVHSQHLAKRHHDLVHRSNNFTIDLEKRQGSNARFTFYDAGLGACGEVNSNADFIVALNAEQFGSGYPGPNCFRRITITANGRSTGATIMDRCPGCPNGGLDFSRGLFNFFAAESVGVISGSWRYADGAEPAPAPAPPPPPPPPPPTTSSRRPQPTTEAPPPPPPEPTTERTTQRERSTQRTTSTPPPPPSTSSTPTPTTTSTVTSTESIDLETGPVSGLALATGSVDPAPDVPNTLYILNRNLLNLAGVAAAGRNLSS